MSIRGHSEWAQSVRQLAWAYRQIYTLGEFHALEELTSRSRNFNCVDKGTMRELPIWTYFSHCNSCSPWPWAPWLVMRDLFLLQQHQISAQALKIFNEPKSNVESNFLKKRGMCLNSNCATCSKTMIIFEGGSHWVGVWGGVSIFKSIGTYILISTSKNRQIVKYLEHRQTTANKEIFLNLPPSPFVRRAFRLWRKKC